MSPPSISLLTSTRLPFSSLACVMLNVARMDAKVMKRLL